LPRRQRLPDITLSKQSPISFVIPSIGTRDEFIDKFIIPSILKQGIKIFEIIIAGHYQGEYQQKKNIHYVPVRKFPIYFYMHFQKGVSECRYDWVVSLGDDMVLADDWYSNLMTSVKTTGDADIYGFRVLNPDGSLCADIGDAFGLRQAGHRIRPTSYFGSYIAKKAMFEVLPYPTYMSCDRHHGFLISKHGFKKRFLPSVCVIHYATLGRKGAIPRAAPEKYHNTIELRRRLGLLTPTHKADYREKALKWFQYASKLERKTKKIGIWGCFGHGNVGDELILSSMTEAFSHHEISVYTDRPEGVETNHNIRLVFHTEELRKHLNELDLLLIGGGEILHNRAITKSFPKELMHNCETPIIVYAAGIPFFDWCNDLYYFLLKCYLVTLRDNLCLSFIKQRFADIPSQLLPDPAFMIQKLQCEKVPGKIVLTTRMIPEGWRQGLPANVNEILREELSSIYHHLVSKGYSPLVLGFERSDEDMLSNQGYHYKMVNSREAVEEIATAELLIGASYHSGVIAVTQHTPVILLNYRKKMEGLKTLISTGINVVNIENLNLVREFDAFRRRKNKYKLPEIEALKEIITEFNDMYVNYVY
jgi:polysaccharide pyruvyl transferase WcaK-like protein